MVRDTTDLIKWEEDLAEKLGGCVLIGELELAPEEAAELGQLIAGVVRRCRERGVKAEKVLEEKYPCAFVTFLVFRGRDGYEEGAYWPAVEAVIGARFNASDWGRIFERVVDNLGLSRPFEGLRYVSPILGHGGIPTDCLPDFFGALLQPSETRKEWAALETPKLIQIWIGYASSHQVDKPIVRFLRDGSAIAEDFVDRCRQMARLAADGETLVAEEMGLPYGVVACYERWLAQSDTERESCQGQRWRMPRLRLDSTRAVVQMWLPPQTLDKAQRHADVRWAVHDGDGQHEFYCEVTRNGRGWQTDERLAALERPQPEYRVELWIENDLVRFWRVMGVDGRRPLLIFDGDSGWAMSARGSLPGRSLWLMCPATARLTFASRSEVEPVRLPRLPLEWGAWKGCKVDLATVASVAVTYDTRKWRYVVVADSAIQRAALEGDVVVGLEEGDAPVYAAAPRLRIPWNASSVARQYLAHWHLELRADADTAALVTRLPLSEPSLCPQFESGYVVLALDSPWVLGPSPFGAFHLQLRDDGRRARDFRFRVVPGLALDGHETLHIPTEDGAAEPVCFDVHAQDGTGVTLDSQRQTSGTTIRALVRGRDYQVVAPPACTRVPLRITYQSSILTLDVPIRRLRWLLALRRDELAGDAWRSGRASLVWDELSQSEEPTLLVDAPGLPSGASVTLRFLAPDGSHLLGASAFRSGLASIWRFDLRQVRDTLRESDFAVAEGHVVVGQPEAETIERAVMLVSKQIQIERVEVSRETCDGQPCLYVAWRPRLRLKWRRILLWPSTRPWEDPVTITIPDSADQEYWHPLALPLPDGHYWLEFTTHNPWLRAAKRGELDADAPNVRGIWLGHPRTRLKQLNAAIANGGAMVEARAERAILEDTAGDHRPMGEDIVWCFLHAEPRHAAVLENLADLVGEDDFWKPTRIRLGHPNIIRHMLKTFEYPSPAEPVLTRYLGLLLPDLLSPEACAALLDAPADLAIRTQARVRLHEVGDALAVEHVLHLLKTGKLDPTEVACMLSQRAEDVAAFIVAQDTDDPVLMKLLAELAQHDAGLTAKFFWPGMWIRCQAGWGRIESLSHHDGRPVGVLPRRPVPPGFAIHVTLRAGYDNAETALINTSTSEITFSDAPYIYVCHDCGKFASRHKRVFAFQHCCKPVKRGFVGPLRAYTNSIRQRDIFWFLPIRPHDPWA